MLPDTKKFTFAILAAVMLISIVGCKKDLAEKGKAEILTNGSWRLTGHTFYSITNTVDIYATYAPCEKDNIFYFNNNAPWTLKKAPQNAIRPTHNLIRWAGNSWIIANHEW